MREPMPEVSSSTQPSGALIMNRWLSPSITTALRVEVSCAAAAGAAAVALLAGVPAERAAGGVAASATAASARAATREPAGAMDLLSGRGSALSGDLRRWLVVLGRRTRGWMRVPR